MSVKAKKHLGQHFLVDPNISKKIALQFSGHLNCNRVLEIGPGMGALTRHLLEHPLIKEVIVMEIDTESIDYLTVHFPELKGRIYSTDFLKVDLKELIGGSPFAVVGNFPYNISSQILFQCIDYKDIIPEIMGMFQKEVAERVAEKPGSKTYGILSVLLQTYYDIEYCFTVDEKVFHPPPKVKSGVIRCKRNNRNNLPCDEKLYKQVVKATFNQRRKTVRNGLKSICSIPAEENHPLLTQRPEKLGVEEFIALTQWVSQFV